MTVETLIKRLQEYEPTAKVKLNDHDGDEVLFVVAYNNDENTVWLEGENDLNLEGELEARFENAAEEQTDELDFYMELIEIGITVEMMEKYMGKLSALKMEQFCKDHGLI